MQLVSKGLEKMLFFTVHHRNEMKCWWKLPVRVTPPKSVSRNTALTLSDAQLWKCLHSLVQGLWRKNLVIKILRLFGLNSLLLGSPQNVKKSSSNHQHLPKPEHSQGGSYKHWSIWSKIPGLSDHQGNMTSCYITWKGYEAACLPWPLWGRYSVWRSREGVGTSSSHRACPECHRQTDMGPDRPTPSPNRSPPPVSLSSSVQQG